MIKFDIQTRQFGGVDLEIMYEYNKLIKEGHSHEDAIKILKKRNNRLRIAGHLVSSINAGLGATYLRDMKKSGESNKEIIKAAIPFILLPGSVSAFNEIITKKRKRAINELEKIN